MALTERLAIILDVNGAAAVKEFEKVGAGAERELGKAENKVDKLGSQLTSVGTKMIGVGAVLVAGFARSAQAAEEANQYHLKLDNTIANSPKLVNASKQAFLDQATALQKVTKADDEAVIGIQALLGQFGLAQDQITNLTPLVVDLAQKMGVDFDTAAKMVGKSVEGSAGALKKAGIQVDATAFANDHYTATVDALRSTVGGFAETEGKTFSGQLAIMKNQLHDLEEGVGVGAAKAFSTLLGKAQGLSVAFTNLDAGTQSTIGEVGTYASVALIAAGATSTMIGFVIKARENFTTAASGVSSFVRGLGTVEGAARAISFTAAVGGMILFTKVMQDNAAEASKWADAVTGGGTLPEQLDNVNKQIEEQERKVKDFRSQDLGPLHLYGSNEGRAEADKLDALKKKKDELQASTNSLTNSEDLQRRGVDALGNAVDDTTESEDKEAKALDDATQARDKAISKMKEFFDVARGQVDTERNLAQAHDDFSRAIKANGPTLELGTQQGRDNQKAFEDAGQAAIDWGVDLMKSGAAPEEAAAKVGLHVAALRNQMLQAGFTQSAVDSYIEKLHLTPNEIATRFKVSGISEATNQVHGLQNALSVLSAMFPEAKRGVDAVLHRSTPLGSNVPQKALGGAASGVIIAGDNGAELINVGSFANVTPNHALSNTAPQAAPGAGEPLTVQVLLDSRVVAEQIVPHVLVIQRGSS